MGDWVRAKIRNSLAPYGPAVHVAVGALHGRPWNMQPPWEQGSLGGVLGSGSFFKPLVMPPEGATLVQSDQKDQPKRPPIRILKPFPVEPPRAKQLQARVRERRGAVTTNPD